jgi:hypothetical protein
MLGIIYITFTICSQFLQVCIYNVDKKPDRWSHNNDICVVLLTQANELRRRPCKDVTIDLIKFMKISSLLQLN